MEELQLQLGKREEELAQSLMRIDEEGAGMRTVVVVNEGYDVKLRVVLNINVVRPLQVLTSMVS